MLPALRADYGLVEFLGLPNWKMFYSWGADRLGYALSFARVNWLESEYGIV